MTDKHKHYDLAYRAHYYTSFTPDKRAEMYCKDFEQSIQKLKDIGAQEKSISKYENLWIKWMSAKSRCASTMITGGSNFNVARNEKANNAERNAGDACSEYYNKVIKAVEKGKFYAENPNARPIQSGDDALERLNKKLDSHKKAHATMIAVNKILRKKPVDRVALLELLGSQEKVNEVLTPDRFNDIGFASHSLNNSRAEIKRIEGRIKALGMRKEQGNKEMTVNGVKIVQNSESIRIQLFFDGKPSDDIRKLLKSNAFRWAPSIGAWQRQLTGNAVYAFNNSVLPELKKLTEMEE